MQVLSSLKEANKRPRDLPPPMSAKPPPLSAVPSTLRIPLAARALGGTLFPQMAVDDRYATDALAPMGDDGQQ